MSKVPCYTVGRATYVAIAVQHETVSRVHAELIPMPDGRIYVTDCASTGGTFISERSRWRRITQEFVDAGERVRFGEMELTVEYLLTEISRVGQTNSAGPVEVSRKNELDASQGVARNPDTGEPIALT